MGALRNRLARRAGAGARALRLPPQRRVIALSPGIRDGGDRRRRAAASAWRWCPTPPTWSCSPRRSTARPSASGWAGGRFVAATSARWARPTTWRRWSSRAASLAEGVTFVLHGRRQAPRRARAPRAAGQRAASSARRPTRRRWPALAAASDACLTLFKDVPVLATNSPNKLFDTFAAGRAGDREHRRLDARAGGGQRGRAVRRAPATRRPGREAGLAARPPGGGRAPGPQRPRAGRARVRPRRRSPRARWACSRRPRR